MTGAWSLEADPIPLYCIGDSTTLIFKDRLFRNDCGPRFLGKTLYLNGCHGADLTGENGALSESIIDALRVGGLVVGDGANIVAFHRANDRHSTRVARALARPIDDPLVFLFFGGLDEFAFLRNLRGRSFRLPGELLHRDFAHPECLEEPEDPVHADELDLLLHNAVEPFERAILELTRLGFSNLFVSSIIPFTTSDATFRFYSGIKASLRERYRATLLFNDAYKTMCDRSGAIFVDSWRKQVRGGYAYPGLLSDEAHLGRQGGIDVVATLYETIESRQQGATEELLQARQVLG